MHTEPSQKPSWTLGETLKTWGREKRIKREPRTTQEDLLMGKKKSFRETNLTFIPRLIVYEKKPPTNEDN